jgi:large subunit ribosomal protein L11
MSKKIVKAVIKLLVPAGGATPAPPVGSALGQHGVNIMDFCKAFNSKTAGRKGETVPVIITVYKDRSITFILKTAPASEMILKKINLKKGSSVPHKDKVGKITWSAIEEIARVKLPDLNVREIEGAKKIIAGTARSMGVDVVEG